MQFPFLETLAAQLAAKFNLPSLDLPVDLCPPNFPGDLTINCFPLAKSTRQNPMALAAEVKSLLEGSPDVASAEVVKAFVNITLTPLAIMKATVAEPGALQRQALLPEAEREKVLIEFSAPNTKKPQHLGHVRNTPSGMSTAQILERAGNQVVRVNLVNDRGIHICKSMIAYQRFGNGITPETAGKKGDHLVGDFYVAFDKAFRQQVAELKAAHPELADKDSEDLFLETEIGRACQDMLVAWENGDPAVRELWQKMNNWVFDGFAETYRRMGIRFDKTYLESQTYQLGKQYVSLGLEKGVFQKREDGAVIIQFPDKNLGTKVVLRSDGTSVYVTQDIGTTLLKKNDFQPDRLIWVVGDEQNRHFKVLFAILKALGFDWADRCVHMAYGMVNLPNGRMKSREGTVVDADDLFDELERLAREATLEKAGGTPPDNLDERARVIAMAALKFMLLKVNPKTTIIFDPNASIKFEGDTGPYVLYAYARISSMLRKAAESGWTETEPAWELLGDDAEKALALRSARFPAAIQKAARELDSSAIANYLLDLAKDFNSFYRNCPVLAAPTPELRNARLVLSSRVRDLLKDGLETLTIGTLESM